MYTEEQIRMMQDGRETLTQLAEDYFWERYKADPEMLGVSVYGGIIGSSRVALGIFSYLKRWF